MPTVIRRYATIRDGMSGPRRGRRSPLAGRSAPRSTKRCGNSVRQSVDDPGDDQVNGVAADYNARHRHHLERGTDLAPGQP